MDDANEEDWFYNCVRRYCYDTLSVRYLPTQLQSEAASEKTHIYTYVCSFAIRTSACRSLLTSVSDSGEKSYRCACGEGFSRRYGLLITRNWNEWLLINHFRGDLVTSSPVTESVVSERHFRQNCHERQLLHDGHG